MEPTPAAHSGELKWLRVNDNDGGNDGDGNQADEGGSDGMMDRRMMVMMTATAMRVMMAITTMNGGAGASDVFFGLHWCMPGFPQPAALTLRARSHTKHASETHTCRAKKSSSQASAHPLTNAPEAAPVLRFALPGGTPLSPRPACASTLLRGNLRPGRTPDLWSART